MAVERISLLALEDLVDLAAGLCCFSFFGISTLVIVVIVASKVFGRKKRYCEECSETNDQSSRFCAKCGTPFPGTGDSRSFYAALLQRITNWRVWGWLREGEYERLQALRERDLSVYEGREKVSAKASAEPTKEVKPAVPPPLVPQDTEVTEPAPSDPQSIEPTGADPPVPAVYESATAEPVKARSVVQPSVRREVVQPGHAEPLGEMRPPRKLSDILQTFMDDSNIKIGEFISGLLILVGSIGLVVTLNVQFKDRVPYLPAAVFMTVVVLFHVAGLYSLQKWNLRSSSKVVLYIANLLIPLNMLAATIRDTLPETQGWMFYVALFVGVVGFGSMSFYSARALMPKRWWPLVLVVIGPTAMQTVIKLLSAQGLVEGIVAVNVVVLIPLAMVALGVLAEHRVLRISARVTTDDAVSLLRVLTLGLFSLAGCVTVLLLKSEQLESLFGLARQLANPFMIMAFIIVSAGMLLHRRMEDPSQVRWRIVGTWMAITGCLGVVGSFTLAVPDIESMLVVSVIGSILALVFARVTRIPFLSTTGTTGVGIAAWCLMVKIRAAETTLLSGRDLADYWFSGITALLLTVAGLACGLMHLSFWRNDSEENREFYRFGFLGVVITATVGLLVAVVCSLFKQAEPATDFSLIVFAVYAFSALIAAVYVNRKGVIVAGVVLVPVTWLQSLNCSCFPNWDSLDGIDKFGIASFGTVVTYVVALVGYWLCGRRGIGCLSRSEKSFAQLFLTGASFTAYLVAAVFTMVQVYALDGHYQEALWRSGVLSGIIVIVALCYLTDWTWMCVQVQGMVTIAAAVTLGWSVQHEGMGLGADSHLRAQLIALSIGMLFWVALRKYCQQSKEIGKIIVTDMMYVDFVVQVVASGVMYLIWLSALIEPLAASYGDTSVLAGMAAIGGHKINYWDWVLWAITLAAWASVIPDRHRRVSSICALVVFSALPILASDQLVQKLVADQVAVPHFLRWGYGILGVVMALIVCTDFLWWKRLVRAFPGFMDNQDAKSTGGNIEKTWALLRVFSFLAAAVPVVYLTVLHYVHVLGIYLAEGEPFQVLSGEVAFFEANPSLTFAAPLWLLMAITWIYGMRTRNAGYLLLGFPFWQCGWMFFGLVPGWLDDQTAHFGDLVHGFNWFLIGLAIYATAWGGLHRWVFSVRQNEADIVSDWKTELLQWGGPARFLFGLTVVSLVVYTCIALIDSFVLTGGIDTEQWQKRINAFGNLEAFVAVFAIGSVLVVWRRAQKAFHDSVLIGSVLLCLNSLIAHLLASRLAVTDGNQQSITEILFNQTVGWTIIFFGLVVFVVNRVPHWCRFSVSSSAETVEVPSAAAAWAGVDRLSGPWVAGANLLAVLIGVGTLVLFRATANSDWVLISLVGSVAAMFILLTGTLQQTLCFGWALLVSLLTIALIDLHQLDSNVYLINLSVDTVGAHFWHLVRTEVAALSLLAILLSTVVDLCTRFLGIEKRADSPGISFSRKLVPVSVVLLGIMSVVAVGAAMAGMSEFWISKWREIGNLGVPLLALAWFGRQEDFKEWTHQVFVWGIALCATLLVMWMVESDVAMHYQVNSVRILYVLTAYLAAWGAIYHFSAPVAVAVTAIGIRNVAERMESNRLFLAHYVVIVGMAVGIATVVSSVFIDTDLMMHRYLVSLLPAGLIIAVQCMRGTSLQDEQPTITVALCLMAILGLLWADLGPSHETMVWLSRVIRLFIAASVLSALVAYLSSRVAEHMAGWLDTWKKLQLGGVVVAALALLVTLLFELASRKLATGMSHLEVLAICIGLSALGTALLMLALKPDRDPLALSDTGRQAYVYLAELIILVLAAHLWRTRPDWFLAFRGSWPYILFAIAFVGAFASEYLRRSGIKVLSEPIHNTSFLLPAVPILGLVLFNDQMTGLAADYRVFFLLTALVNVVMAFYRRSFLYAMVAALAGNASLWAVFAGFENFQFVDHPQFWLIPPAVSVLIAAQLNRGNLTIRQLSFLRYAAISLIYLASTSEMILKWAMAEKGIQGLAILGGLSLLGVVVGMLYRIRQFVYLGLGFFLLAMMGTVFKISTYNQLWFWVALVLFGAIMLAVFAAREKYLPVLKRKVKEMEGWDESSVKED